VTDFARPLTRKRESAALAAVDRLVWGMYRYGSAWVLAGMLLLVTLPFAAPLLMAAGWTGPGEFLYRLYALFCHQLPQRSWFLFGPKFTYTLAEISQAAPAADAWGLRVFYGTPEMGWKVAWSDRMISFYTMTPIFGLFYMLLRRLRPIRPLPWRLLVLALLPLALDGGAHALNDLLYGISASGFRDTNAWLALLTGNAFPAFYKGDHAGTFNWWMRLLTGLLAAWSVAFWFFPWLDRVFYEESSLRQRTHGRDEPDQPAVFSAEAQ